MICGLRVGAVFVLKRGGFWAQALWIASLRSQ
jgi:hypothetical protein